MPTIRWETQLFVCVRMPYLAGQPVCASQCMQHVRHLGFFKYHTQSVCREARLYVCSNGQGSPCLDLRRVPDTLADATVGADLVVVEGMGRSIHTNYR